MRAEKNVGALREPLAKRCSELYGLRRDRQESPAGRGYLHTDLEYALKDRASYCTGFLIVVIMLLARHFQW